MERVNVIRGGPLTGQKDVLVQTSTTTKSRATATCACGCGRKSNDLAFQRGRGWLTHECARYGR